MLGFVLGPGQQCCTCGIWNQWLGPKTRLPSLLSLSCHSILLATQLPEASTLPHLTLSHWLVPVSLWQLYHAIYNVH